MDQRIRSRVLIVEDSVTVKLLLRDLFRELGFVMENIHGAWDGEEGLRMALRIRFALIVSGWNMPFMNGLALLRALRAEERTKDIPFIMVTGDDDRLRVGEAAAAGATGFLPKPISPFDFTEKLRPVFRDTEDEARICWDRFARRVRQV